MPHVPNFPSEDTDESEDERRERTPGSIIDRIIDNGELPVTTGI
ncbi:hypothetical protein NP511_15120 [Natrinema thermotolerans]|uniref:Uncharacterized protein n=1 Tax=Natrinema thermotolerans TaxID=121872 RepID=A0AAF0P969_9EURY|nr:hypothetical protein [Natrinema thermotolerans]WMT06711.1 hypothetical protein NP511_15120 [Natrinema thermotolerans]